MGTFDSLDKDVPSSISTTEKIGSTYATFHTIENKMDSFLEQIESGAIENVVIRQVILSYFDMYLSYDSFEDPATREVAQKLWQNERFLNAMIYIFQRDFVNLPQKITISQRSCINKLAFDYKYNKKDNKDEKIEGLLLELAKLVDRPYLLTFNSIMYEKSALLLTMARFSSFNSWTCVSRLNYFILRMEEELSVKSITYIYTKFYGTNFSTLFCYTMIDVDTTGLSGVQMQKYENMSVSILNMLESMSDSEMHTVLQYYASYIFLMYNKGKYRFSLQTIPDVYHRTLSMVQKMTTMEDIKLP